MRDASRYMAAKHEFVESTTDVTAKCFLSEAKEFHVKVLTADKDFVDMHM